MIGINPKRNREIIYAIAGSRHHPVCHRLGIQIKATPTLYVGLGAALCTVTRRCAAHHVGLRSEAANPTYDKPDMISALSKILNQRGVPSISAQRYNAGMTKII